MSPSVSRVPVAVAATAVAPIVVLGLVVWPGATLLALAVAGVALITRRDPVAGLCAAVLLFSFEGAAKLSLAAWGSPVSADARAQGALAVDLALAIPIAVLLVGDRARTPIELWRRASAIERVAFGALLAWLAVSALQVLQNDDLVSGLEGFRLSQGYVLVALAGLVAFRPPVTSRTIRLLLVVVGIVVAYAALRVATGPFDFEQGFVEARDPGAVYYADGPGPGPIDEEIFRAVGSFQSAVALASFLAPALVFTLIGGILVSRWRPGAWPIALLAGVAVLASFTRIAIVAIVLACALGLLLAIAARGGRARPARLLAAAAAIAAVSALGVAIAGGQSASLTDRAEGFVDPADDRSLRARLETWEVAVDRFASKPLGAGVGTVGRATEEGPDTFITDNSFLKVLVEQGVVGVPLFLIAIVGISVAAGMRLGRAPPGPRELGIASLAAFVAFVLLWTAGEYIEQPGKVLAWLLLGIAVGQAFLADEPEEP